MARINFEDRIFREQGFQDLMIEVRSRLLAKGIALELFQLAQEFWFPDRRPIPMDRFKAAGLPDILFAAGGLCELVEGDVYVRGSKQAFQWLFDASDAGKKSAEARKQKSGTAQPKRPRQKKTESLERPLNGVQRPSKVVQEVSTSLLSSPSSLLSSPDSNSNSIREATTAILKTDSKTAEYLAKVSDDVQRAWLTLYPKYWVEQECKAAVVWCLANPRQGAKTEWPRFFTGWLKRGFDPLKHSARPVMRTPPEPGQTVKFDTVCGPLTDSGSRSLSFADILSMVPSNLGGQKGAS
jgi:hypothetical protein